MAEPNQHLINAVLAARAALRAVTELMRDTHQGDPLLDRLDGTGDAIRCWLERYMTVDNVAPAVPLDSPVADHIAPHSLPAVASAATSAVPERPPTTTAAVQLASAQLPEGATFTEIAAQVLNQYGIKVEPGAVRTILSRGKRNKKAQQSAAYAATPPHPLQPEPPKVLRGTGGYL